MIVIGQPPTVQSASRARGHAPVSDRKYRNWPVAQTSAHAQRRAGRWALPQTTDDACYRAMDWLLQIREQLEKAVFDQVAEVLGLEVDLLFFDTTSTYFVTEQPTPPSPATSRAAPSRAAPGLPLAAAGRPGSGPGASPGDHHDLPQIVIGMAVTRTASRCAWCWPGTPPTPR
jgi:hypothetical protein